MHAAPDSDPEREDRSFDVVGSPFGVAKPGGVPALTSWANDGYTGQTLATTMKYVPAPPEGIDTAVDWVVKM